MKSEFIQGRLGYKCNGIIKNVLSFTKVIFLNKAPVLPISYPLINHCVIDKTDIECYVSLTDNLDDNLYWILIAF